MRALIGVSREQMLAETVIAVRDTLHADFAEVLQLVDDGAALLLQSVAGWPQELVGRTRQRIGPGSQASYALQVRAPVVVHDLHTETRFTPPPLLREYGVRSGITVIVHAPRAPFGVLGVHTREPRAFTDDDAYFMQSVANLLAAALERHGAEAEREELLARTAAAQAEAERASRAKSEFLGMMSHELRTPLNAIGGYASLMSEGIRGPVTDAQRTDLARIRRSQQYLVGLIDNVLSYLRLGSARITYDIAELRVEELLDTAEELVRLQIEAKELYYERPRRPAPAPTGLRRRRARRGSPSPRGGAPPDRSCRRSGRPPAHAPAAEEDDGPVADVRLSLADPEVVKVAEVHEQPWRHARVVGLGLDLDLLRGHWSLLALWCALAVTRPSRVARRGGGACSRPGARDGLAPRAACHGCRPAPGRVRAGAR